MDPEAHPTPIPQSTKESRTAYVEGSVPESQDRFSETN